MSRPVLRVLGCAELAVLDLGQTVFNLTAYVNSALHNIDIVKVKNIFTKLLKDVGIEVPKCIETSSACMQTKTGGNSL